MSKLGLRKLPFHTQLVVMKPQLNKDLLTGWDALSRNFFSAIQCGLQTSACTVCY